MGKNIIELIVTGKDLTGKELDQVNKNIDKIGKSLQRAGAIATAAGVAMTGAFIAAARESQNLQHEIAKALTLVDASSESYTRMEANLTKLAISMSRKLNIAADEVSRGFYQVLSTGAEAGTKDFENMTESALRLSKVVGLETSRSVEVLSDTINAFNGRMQDAELYANTFFLTSRLTTTTVDQLAEAMRTAGPTAAALRVPLNQTAATLAALAAKGTKASEAGTAFRMMMLRLTTPTAEARKELDRLEVSVFDNEGNMRNLIDVFKDLQKATSDMTAEEKALTLETIAGDRAFTKLGAILESDLDKIQDWSDRLGSTTELQEAHNNLLTSAAEKYERVKIEIKNAALMIGAQMLPTLTELYEKTAQILQALGEWAERNPEIVRGVIMFSGALVGAGGLAVAIGTVMRAVAALKLLMVTAFSPTSLVLAGIAGLALAFIKLKGNIDDAKRQLDALVKEAETKHTIQIEMPEAAEKGIKFAVEFVKGKAYLEHYAKIIAELESKARDDVIEFVIEGKLQKTTVDDAITYIREQMIDIEVRMGIEKPAVQTFLEDVNRKLEDAKKKLEWWTISVPIEGKMKELTREEYIRFLMKTKEQLERGEIPEEMKIKAPTMLTADEQEQERVKQQIDEQWEWYQALAQKIEDEIRPKVRAAWLPPYSEVEAWKQEYIVRAQEAADEVDLVIVSEDDVDGAMRMMGVMESGWNAALQRMLDKTNKWRDSITAFWKSIASAIIAELSRIIAKFVMVGVARMLAFNIPLPGFLAGPVATIGAMQGGGTPITTRGVVHSGIRGRDTVRADVGLGETIIDHTLTEDLRDFLNERIESGGAGLTVNIYPGVYSGTEQDAIDLASHLYDRNKLYDRKNVAKGSI